MGKHFIENENNAGWECRHCSAAVRCKSCLKTVRGGTSDVKRHRDQRCSAPTRSPAVQRQAVKRRRRKGAASSGDEPCLTPPHRPGRSANAVARWSGSRHGGTETLRAVTALAGAGVSDGSLQPSAAHGTGQEQGHGVLATPSRADDSGTQGSSDGGLVSPAAHGIAARRYWAVGVRAAGGPEAVAAALRARYPRLYST